MTINRPIEFYATLRGISYTKAFQKAVERNVLMVKGPETGGYIFTGHQTNLEHFLTEFEGKINPYYISWKHIDN